MRTVSLSLALSCALSVAAAMAQGGQETVYKPGDGVSFPQVIKEVKPTYPRPGPNSPRGTVLMECVVARDGRPTDIIVVQKVDPELDEAAVGALAQWEFKPGMKDGKAVAVRVSVEMTFTVK